MNKNASAERTRGRGLLPRGSTLAGAARALSLTALVLGGSTSAAARAAADGGPSPEERQLIEARRQNEEAQARYYGELTNRLVNPTPTPQPTPRKSFRESVEENPASVLGVVSAVLAALFAALVGLLSLYVNNRAALRTRSDTNFYEALKRFGDKDSVAVRSGASVALAEMAKMRLREFHAPEPVEALWRGRRPYFDIAHKQLSMGLLLEENGFALMQIRGALIELTEAAPGRIVDTTENTNRRLQSAASTALAEFMAMKGVTDGDSVAEALWQDVPTYFYDPPTFKLIKQYNPDRFKDALKGALLKYASLETDAAKKAGLSAAYQSLLLASYRLYLAAGLYAHGLRTSSALRVNQANYTIFLVDAELKGADLAGADLENFVLVGADFEEADMRRADLKKARLDRANVKGARLHGATFDESTGMEEVRWWEADFYRADGKHVDETLLAYLFKARGAGVPADMSTFHPSVREYKEGKERKQSGKGAGGK